MAIVHIYSEYPNYEWVEAKGEGIACVDDVARAAVFYLRYYNLTHTEYSLRKAKKLLDFLLYMQAQNGLFYNFIFSDLSINKKTHNSKPIADWWAWRAVWALGEAFSFFRDKSPNYSQLLAESIQKTIPHIDSLLSCYPKKKQNEGFSQPIWLPFGTAADQGSVLLLALLNFYETTQDSDLLHKIVSLGDGISGMQIGDSTNFPFGMFLSWKNVWHPWGNSQAAALLEAGTVISNKVYIEKAVMEVRYFYPYLARREYLSYMEFNNKNGKIELISSKQFPQIAYDIRPLVMASLKASTLTGDDKFAKQAAEIGCWLLGENIVGKPIYDPKSGRCFDGIQNVSEINKNSGAESTIEALLTLLEIEKNKISRELIHDYYRKYTVY